MNRSLSWALAFGILISTIPGHARGQPIREGDRIRITAPAILPEPQAG